MDKLNDKKHGQVVGVRLTDREFFDASRLCSTDDRTLADFIRHSLRLFMYGRVAEADCQRDEIKSAD